MSNERRELMEDRRKLSRIVPVLVLVLLVAAAAALGAQELPDGLVFSGSVTTGLRYRSRVSAGVIDNPDPTLPPIAVYNENVFDIDAGDDYLVEGDTVALRGALNKGTYGANFGLSLNANNTQGNFWTPARLYVSEASLWAKLLENKIGVKAGFFGDFDYFSPVNAWNLGPAGGTNAIQLTAYPIEGLQIDVRTKNSASNTNGVGDYNPPDWYKGDEYLRNVDVGARYSNATFTAFVAFDDDFTPDSRFTPFDVYLNNYQADIFAYFAYTGVPKLSVGVESKFLDLASDRKKGDGSGDAVGITNVTALNASYQITDALSARAWFAFGSATDGLEGANELLGDDGFTFTVDAEGTYKLNDALTFHLRPIFNVPNSENFDVFNFSLRPKVAWTLASFPYGATINFWYKLRIYGEKTASYAGNDNEALNHSLAVTFSWAF
jgi:hypothetical protein